jgi:hypothetical protein
LLERQNNQGIAHQHGCAFTISGVNGGFAASEIGGIETGKIVVDERGAMKKLNGRSA